MTWEVQTGQPYSRLTDKTKWCIMATPDTETESLSQIKNKVRRYFLRGE